MAFVGYFSNFMNYIKYLHIQYKHLGRDWSGCDCFGLVQLFYRTEFNIILPDYTEYCVNWELTDAKKILRIYKSFGFVKSDYYEFGDVVLLNESGYPKHLGVVLNDNYFLHTTREGTACHSLLTGHYSNKINCLFTYKR